MLTTPKLLIAASIAMAIFSFTAPAMAQSLWVWVDSNGIRQYSDTPPPSSIPKSRILKQPAAAPVSDAEYNSNLPDDPEAAAPSGNAPQPPQTLAEKNAEFQKRRQEKLEAEKKSAEEQQRTAEKSRSCEMARGNLRALERGGQVVRTGSDGQRHYLTDQERTEEAQRMRTFLEQCN